MDEFLKNLALWLKDNTPCVYETSEPYSEKDWAIVFGEMPQTPNNILAVTIYDIDYDGTYGSEIVDHQVQFRYRHTDPMAWVQLHKALHTLHRKKLTLDGVTYRITDNSFIPLGRDKNNRYEHSHNFTFSGYRPGTQ